MVQVGYITRVSVPMRFTQPRASGPQCVNRVETSTLRHNLHSNTLHTESEVYDINYQERQA